ncbi:MAG: FAD-binding oxidoreductase [Armatimonadota bacterium]
MPATDYLPLLAALIGEENVKLDMDTRTHASRSWSPLYTKAKMAGNALVVDAVALPEDTEQVTAVVRWANEHKALLVPVGGGSNIVGNGGADSRSAGIVALDLSRLQTIRLEEESLLVHVGAGYSLAALEDQLNAHEYTLGFLPQSLHLAAVGGAVASNAIGLFSGRYGRQRDITAGLEVVLPNGSIIRTSPAPGGNAAFDLHDLFIGSEGTLGVITEVALRMRPIPEVRAWTAFTFTSFGDAVDALRLIYRSDARPAAIRLLDTEAAGALLAGDIAATASPLLLLAFEGDELAQTGPYQIAYAVCQKVGGTAHPAEIGEKWFDEERSRTDWLAPNARPGGLADVFAVSAPWSAIKAVYAAARAAVNPLVTHLDIQITHAYPTGAAVTCRFEAQAEPPTPEAAAELYGRIAAAVFSAIEAAGGSIAHHYGVGSTRRAFFQQERGPEATAALRALKNAFDPNGVLPQPPA